MLTKLIFLIKILIFLASSTAIYAGEYNRERVVRQNTQDKCHPFQKCNGFFAPVAVNEGDMQIASLLDGSPASEETLKQVKRDADDSYAQAEAAIALCKQVAESSSEKEECEVLAQKLAADNKRVYVKP